MSIEGEVVPDECLKLLVIACVCVCMTLNPKEATAGSFIGHIYVGEGSDNLLHAEKSGLTPESIVHWKDTTLSWKRAYEGLDWPVLSMLNVDTSILVNPMVQYPPVVAPKCGRPVRVRRIMGAEEAAHKQMRVRAVPHCRECQKWGHTSRSKLCALFKKK